MLGSWNLQQVRYRHHHLHRLPCSQYFEVHRLLFFELLLYRGFLIAGNQLNCCVIRFQLKKEIKPEHSSNWFSFWAFKPFRYCNGPGWSLSLLSSLRNSNSGTSQADSPLHLSEFPIESLTFWPTGSKIEESAVFKESLIFTYIFFSTFRKDHVIMILVKTIFCWANLDINDQVAHRRRDQNFLSKK